jgi:hypothetical protein
MTTQNPLETINEPPRQEQGFDGFAPQPQEEEEAAAEPQPKRRGVNAGGLLLFGLLAAVGVITYVMVLRTGTQRGLTSSASAADATISTFLSGGVQNLRQMVSMLHNTEKVVHRFDTYPSARQVPLSDLRTNPFRAKPLSAAPAAPLNADAAERQLSDQRRADAAVAAGLKLESVVFGARSVCIINGKPYAQGEGTDAFTVAKILPQQVQVRIGGEPFVLKMAPPQAH